VSRRARLKWAAAALVGLAGGGACSAILGLDPPPAPGVVGGDAAAPDAGSPVCAPLDAVTDAHATYFPLTPVTLGGSDAGTWAWFDTSVLAVYHPLSFSGGTFDGRYVYFAGRGGGFVAQYDTTAGGFDLPGSWASFDTNAKLGVPGGFEGAIFLSVPESRMARFDTTGKLANVGSWATFDVSALTPDGGSVTSGFVGAGFDGRYLYLVPHWDGAADGRVVRFDTTEPDAGAPPDAGHAGDAGDAGHPADAGEDDDGGDFAELSRWSTFDVGAVNRRATGFSGAAFDGTAIYFAPTFDDGGVDNGFSSVTARYRVGGAFTTAASWSLFDLTTVNGLAYDFVGAGFDGRYVYFAPRGPNVVARYDTASGQFGSIAAWSTYDLTRVLPRATPDAAASCYAGVAFDGRFVSFIPCGVGFATVARYDTLSTFDADCAWSSADLTQIDVDGAVPENFNGAVFDGQYLYLIPNSNGIAARFEVKTPPSMPALPAFHGSFF
jgi:hypothetical protein